MKNKPVRKHFNFKDYTRLAAASVIFILFVSCTKEKCDALFENAYSTSSTQNYAGMGVTLSTTSENGYDWDYFEWHRNLVSSIIITNTQPGMSGREQACSLGTGKIGIDLNLYYLGACNESETDGDYKNTANWGFVGYSTNEDRYRLSYLKTDDLSKTMVIHYDCTKYSFSAGYTNLSGDFVDLGISVHIGTTPSAGYGMCEFHFNTAPPSGSQITIKAKTQRMSDENPRGLPKPVGTEFDILYKFNCS